MFRKILYLISFIISVCFLLIYSLINRSIKRPNSDTNIEFPEKEAKMFDVVSSDGINIKGYFWSSKTSGDTVILCHGQGVNKNHMADMIPFLRNAGYGVLLFDFRAHGESSGQLCTVGINEWKDIKAVITKAKELRFIAPETRIAAYGRSMGAAALINGSEALTEIDAFILESSFARLRLIFANYVCIDLHMPDTPLSDLALRFTELVTGVDCKNNNPVEKIIGTRNKAIFLIHDCLDRRADKVQFDMLKKQVPHGTTWEVADARHVSAHKKAPEEFENRILNFLKNSNIIGIK